MESEMSEKQRLHDRSLSDPTSLSEQEWRALLSPEKYRILRQSGTERAGTGPYLHHEQPGAFHCAGCGNKLYAAQHKFHSGCGWPSFFQEVEEGALSTHRDLSFGMLRLEMRCARCGGHMGHIFGDAPEQPTGLRHCVNGEALVFVPVDGDPGHELSKQRGLA